MIRSVGICGFRPCIWPSTTPQSIWSDMRSRPTAVPKLGASGLRLQETRLSETLSNTLFAVNPTGDSVRTAIMTIQGERVFVNGGK